jgi:hypothetical protein
MSDFIDQESGGSTGSPPPETPVADIGDTERKPLTEALFREEAEKIFDAAEARSAKDDSQRMIPTASKNITEAFDNTAAWMDKSAEQQEGLRYTHDTVARIKANAAAAGLTISDEAALDQALKQEAQEGTVPAALQPALQSVQQTYPDMAPHEAVGRYVEMDRLVRSNPSEAVSQILKNTGHDELSVLRQMAMKFNPAQLQQSFELQQLERYIEGFMDANPGVSEAALMETIEKMKKTGDGRRDFRTAVEQVTKQKRSGRSGGRSRNYEVEMAETLSRIEAREAGRR